jgi:hypothetical protein
MLGTGSLAADVYKAGIGVVVEISMFKTATFKVKG